MPCEGSWCCLLHNINDILNGGIHILNVLYAAYCIRDNHTFYKEYTIFLIVSRLRKGRQGALLRMVIYEWSSYATVTCQNN